MVSIKRREVLTRHAREDRVTRKETYRGHVNLASGFMILYKQPSQTTNVNIRKKFKLCPTRVHSTFHKPNNNGFAVKSIWMATLVDTVIYR